MVFGLFQAPEVGDIDMDSTRAVAAPKDYVHLRQPEPPLPDDADLGTSSLAQKKNVVAAPLCDCFDIVSESCCWTVEAAKMAIEEGSEKAWSYVHTDDSDDATRDPVMSDEESDLVLEETTEIKAIPSKQRRIDAVATGETVEDDVYFDDNGADLGKKEKCHCNAPTCAIM